MLMYNQVLLGSSLFLTMYILGWFLVGHKSLMGVYGVWKY